MRSQQPVAEGAEPTQLVLDPPKTLDHRQIAEHVRDAFGEFGSQLSGELLSCVGAADDGVHRDGEYYHENDQDRAQPPIHGQRHRQQHEQRYEACAMLAEER